VLAIWCLVLLFIHSELLASLKGDTYPCQAAHSSGSGIGLAL
jgi:hypothetical protein